MTRGPVLEHAQLTITPGSEAEYEAAFAEAEQVISRQPGCRSVRLLCGVEEPSSYLLLVEWDRLEDHTECFVQSADFQRWRALVGPFYAERAVVRHYSPVAAPAT